MLVLGRGAYKRLSIASDARELLEASDVEVEDLHTEDAVRRVNELRESGRTVAALLHTTC